MNTPVRNKGPQFGTAVAGFVAERHQLAAANTRKLGVVTPQGPKAPTHG
jgi:hypothetical protein